MRIGKRIYYLINTGEVVVIIGDRSGIVTTTTLEDDLQNYKILTELNAEAFNYIELEYGLYDQDFRECNGYRVNPETKTLEFSYPDPNEPTVEQPYQAPLSEKVKQLELAQSVTDTTLLELMESLLK